MRKIFIVFFVMAALCLALPSAALAVAVIYGPPEIKFDMPDRNIASMDDPSGNDNENDRPLNEKVLTVGFGGKQWKVIGYKPEGGTYSGVLLRGDSPHGGSLPPSTVNSYMTLLLANGSSFGGTVQFHKDSSNSNVYAVSNLKDQMEAAYNSISSGLEKNLVLPRTLETGTYSSIIADWCDGVRTTEVTDAKFWPLSTREASFVPTSVRMFNDFWWLRSPGIDLNLAAHVNINGNVYVNGNNVNFSLAARPAFSLNLSSVLFTSAASGASGKNFATEVGKLYPTEPPTTTGADNAVKFTVKDSSLTLNSTDTAARTVQSGGAVSIAYTGASVGTNRYVSCVIVDDSDTVLFYGKLASAATETDGTASFSVPAAAALPDGYYTIKLFLEEANGDNLTDFASAPVEISMIVKNSTGGGCNAGVGTLGALVMLAAYLGRRRK